MQQHFEFFPRQMGTDLIQQRISDGYINATSMCRAAGKTWSSYSQKLDTDRFIAELSKEIGISRQELVQSHHGTDANTRGVWVHPQIAIHLAQWLSPRFQVIVTQWVHDWLSGRSYPARNAVPYHIRRYINNAQNVPHGHFSVLTEMILSLIGPMEIMGYTLPEHMLPDISQGRMFCRWLREEKGIDTNALPTYSHQFEDGRIVQAKAYPDIFLHDFRRHFREDWLPNQAVRYFSGRDNNALQYLPRLLIAPIPPRQIGAA